MWTPLTPGEFAWLVCSESIQSDGVSGSYLDFEDK